MGVESSMNMPLGLMLVYGIIEKIVLLMFIFSITASNMDKYRIFAMSVIITIATLVVRHFFNYYALIIILNIIIYILIVKLFSKGTSLRIISIATVLMFIVVIITEMISNYVGDEYFAYLNDYYLWLLTGLPHLMILSIITYIIKRLKNVQIIISKE